MTKDDNSLLEQAIKGRRAVEFNYENAGVRRGNPHALYFEPSTESALLDVYQLSGASKTGQLPTWKRFHVGSITDVVLCETVFEPALEYRPNSPRYANVIAKV